MKIIYLDGIAYSGDNPVVKYNYHYRRCLCPRDFGIKRGDNKYLYSLGFVDGVNRRREKRYKTSSYNYGYFAGFEESKKA